jgi:hypothetical protein
MADRQNVDKITESMEFIWTSLEAARRGYVTTAGARR